MEHKPKDFGVLGSHLAVIYTDPLLNKAFNIQN